MQQIQDVLLDGPASREIVDMDIMLLPEPMYPPDPLLQPHRVPGEIEVDHVMAKL
ncbi:hypothetical protein D3C73_1513130 [compost metagenome]